LPGSVNLPRQICADTSGQHFVVRRVRAGTPRLANQSRRGGQIRV